MDRSGSERLTLANLILNLGGSTMDGSRGLIEDCSTHKVSLLFSNTDVIIVTVCHNYLNK